MLKVFTIIWQSYVNQTISILLFLVDVLKLWSMIDILQTWVLTVYDKFKRLKS
jgi:hypothetical protein